MRARQFAFGAALAAFATPAHTHGSIEGLGAVYSGLLHPVLVPAEALAVVATGLALGVSGVRACQLGLPAFVIGLAAGLGAAASTDPWPAITPLLLAIALVAGALVAAGIKLPALAALGLAALAGIAIGIDAFPEFQGVRAGLSACAATVLGGSLAVMAVAGLVIDRKAFWQQVAARVVGSWITASTALYFAWSLTTNR